MIKSAKSLNQCALVINTAVQSQRQHSEVSLRSNGLLSLSCSPALLPPTGQKTASHGPAHGNLRLLQLIELKTAERAPVKARLQGFGGKRVRLKKQNEGSLICVKQ